MASLAEKALPDDWDTEVVTTVPVNLLAAGRPQTALHCSKACQQGARSIAAMHLEVDGIMRQASTLALRSTEALDCRKIERCLLAADLLSADHHAVGGGSEALINAEKAAYERHGRPWNVEAVSTLLDRSLDAIEHAPLNIQPRLWRWHSQLLERVGRVDEAHAEVLKAIDIPDGAGHITSAALVRIGETERALQVTEKNTLLSSKVDSQLRIARELMALNDPAQAVQVTLRAIQDVRGFWTTNMTGATAPLREAARLFAIANRADLAQVSAERAYETAAEPDTPIHSLQKFSRSRYLIDAAWSFLYAGDTERSRTTLRKAIDVLPADSDPAPSGSFMGPGRFGDSPYRTDYFADITGALCRLGEHADAVAFGRRLRDSKVVFALYACKADRGDADATPETAAAALRTRPNGYLYYCVAVRFIERGDDADAAIAIQSAAALNSSATDGFARPALVRLAVALRREDLARALMRRILLDIQFSSRATMSKRLSEIAALTARYPMSHPELH